MGGFTVKSTNETKLLWEQRIEERVKSGTTIAKWCKNNGINKGQYQYWKSRIYNNNTTGEENTFAEITPLLSTTEATTQNLNSSSDFQIFFKNVQITVPSNFKPTSLSGLMKVLQEL